MLQDTISNNRVQIALQTSFMYQNPSSIGITMFFINLYLKQKFITLPVSRPGPGQVEWEVGETVISPITVWLRS